MQPTRSSILEGRPSRIRELEAAARRLEPDSGERDRLMGRAHAYAQSLLGGFDERPVFQSDVSAVPTLRDFSPRADGRTIESLLDLFDESVVRPALLASHPGHLGYIPGGGLYGASLGDYLAAVTNEFSGVRFTGPGAVEMENLVLDWMARLVGLPPQTGGNLASGGSMATLVAVVAAREAARLRARDFERVVAYESQHAHHCLQKALRVTGMGEAVRREVPLDDAYRMRPDALARQIARDRAAGLRPWLVAANAGTTDVGAVDPLLEIADVAHREGVWYHVDAAYGGFFALVDAARPILAGMERAESIVLDPHKGMFLPYGTGAVLVRDREALAAAHRASAHILQDAAAAELEGLSPAAASPELTKHFRGLRVWLPLLLHGETPFRACLEEKLELARYFHREIGRLGFEVGPAPQLSVVTYRWVPETGDADAFNRALVREVHEDGRVFITSTSIDGRVMLRMAALCFRTHLDTVNLALEVLREAVERVSARSAPPRHRATAHAT